MSTTPSPPPGEENEPRFDFRQQANQLFASLPPETTRHLQWQARRLGRQLPSAVASHDDHEQDLALDLLKKLPQFDERRAGLRTFASHIIDSSAGHLHRHYRARKRAGQTTPLTAHHADGDLRRTESREATNRWELATDSQACLDQLTPLQRQLCHYLGDHPEREIAKTLGITRHTVRAEVQRIRRCFIRNEMRAYL